MKSNSIMRGEFTKKKGIDFVSLFAGVCILVGCNNSYTNAGKSNNTNSDTLISEYSIVGVKHNELLGEFYNALDKSRAVVSDENSAIYEDTMKLYFGEELQVVSEKQWSVGGRNVASESVVQDLQEQSFISSEVSYYLEAIEGVLANPCDSLEDTQKQITEIENEALLSLSESDIAVFLSYAETSKASLDFWTDKYSEDTDVSEARGIFSDLWNKYKHKIAMAAASDAAGAAVGAAIGGSIAGKEGAIISAVLAGAVSSEEGFRRDCVCVIIPITEIMKRLGR